MNVGKRIFHLYTTNSESWQLHLEFPREGKILGIFVKPPRVIEVSIYDLSLAEKLLLLFFDGKDQQLIDTCRDL